MDQKPPPTILVIDNDEGMTAAVSTRLECLGFECVTAQTGAQGVAEFDPDRIDLVITDLNMPSLDGVGVVQKIREKCGVPIIVVTGFRKEYTDGLRELKDIQVIEKPFRIQDLIDMVETEVYLNKARSAA